MSKLRVLDLFSGIGGFSLGLERTGGFETVAFCEIEDYPRRVLAKHWPGVPCYDDVRTLTADRLAADGIAVDVICGGFPCQDVSFAGKRAGLEGARSGLWREYARLIGELRPKFVLVENVPGLLNLGMGTVLGDLSALGYDAAWDCVPAAAVGAPHRRDRVWVVAYANAAAVQREAQQRREQNGVGSRNGASTNPYGSRLEGRHGNGVRECPGEWTARTSSPYVADAPRELLNRGLASPQQAGRRKFTNGCWWGSEPNVGRVAHGIFTGLDRGLNAKEYDQTASADGRTKSDPLRGVRRGRASGAAPSELQRTRSVRGALSALPCESGPARRNTKDAPGESLHPMRGNVHADTQQEAQLVQREVQVGDGAYQRREAVGHIWFEEPAVPRVATGVKHRVDRLKGLGNAVVPQIPELIGRAILSAINHPSVSRVPAPSTNLERTTP